MKVWLVLSDPSDHHDRITAELGKMPGIVVSTFWRISVFEEALKIEPLPDFIISTGKCLDDRYYNPVRYLQPFLIARRNGIPWAWLHRQSTDQIIRRVRREALQLQSVG